MPLREYGRLDALALADLIRRREVTPGELLETARPWADPRPPVHADAAS